MWGKKEINVRYNKHKDMNEYIIEYFNSPLQPKDIRYDILSWLREERSIISEIDNGLFSIDRGVTGEEVIDDIIYNMQQKDILFKYRKIKNADAATNPLAKLFGFGSKKPVYSHKIYYSIPDRMWDIDIIHQVIPIYGCRHTVLQKEQDLDDILENFDRGLYEDIKRSDVFYCDAFDCETIKTFAIRSNFIQKDEVEKIVDELNSRASD